MKKEVDYYTARVSFHFIIFISLFHTLSISEIWRRECQAWHGVTENKTFKDIDPTNFFLYRFWKSIQYSDLNWISVSLSLQIRLIYIPKCKALRCREKNCLNWIHETISTFEERRVWRKLQKDESKVGIKKGFSVKRVNRKQTWLETCNYEWMLT